MMDAAAIPLTSIIIVTYNRLEQTRECVDSIVAGTAEPYELIFVDNASSDGTAAYLRERFGTEAVIANDTNEGFLRGANRGIAASRGAYVVLLNNDTTVDPGWLAALHEAVERVPNGGIASGKIVGPGGRVQLAGAYIAFDGSARMIGEGLSPDDPSLSEEREVCYVGGHCMLIRREVLDSLGMLDEAYGFGYHEDTEYCYRARAAGFKVVYAPGCVVHHQLFGTPLPERQRIIRDNQRRFLDRWGDQLFLWRFVRGRVELRADQLELPLGAGWYAAESEYTCMGGSAWCYLKSPAEEGGVLEIVAMAPHPDLAERPLHLEVLVDGQLVGHGFFGTPWETKQLFFPVNSSQLTAVSHQLSAISRQPSARSKKREDDRRRLPLKVELRVDRTWRPDELFQDGRDPREIGLAVRRIGAGTVAEATTWAAEGIAVADSLRRLREHADFLQAAIVEKDAFYARELEGKERLIAQLQANLERYHATPPFRAYFALKRLLGGK